MRNIQIFELFGTVLLKADGVTKGLDNIDKKAQDTEKKMNKSFSNIANAGSKVKDAMGAIGLVAGTFLVSAVEAASKASAATDQLKIKLQNQGIAWSKAKGQVDQFTSGITKMSIYSAGEAKAALDNLITKHVSLANALKDASGMTELAAAKHISLADASNIVADAENGRLKGLVKLGIVTKEEAKNGISMDEVNKRLNKSYKGLAEGAMLTLPGAITKIGNNFTSFKIGIGTVLLPVIVKFAGALGKVSDYLNNVSGPTKKLIAGFLVAVTAIGLLTGGVGLITRVLSVLGPVVSGLGGLIGGLTLPIVAIIAAVALLGLAFKNNWGGIRTQTMAFLAYIGPLIMNVFKGVVDWFKANWPMIEKTVITVFNNVMSAYNQYLKPVLVWMIAQLKQVLDWVKENWPTISKTISTVLNGAMSVIKSVLNAIKVFWNIWGKSIMDYVKTTFKIIGDVISTAIHVIEDVIKLVMDVINGNWKAAWHDLVKACGDIFGGVKKVIGDIINGIKNQFLDFAKSAINLGKGIIDGIISGIKAQLSNMGSAVKTVVDFVIKKFKDLFGIASPAKPFIAMGGFLIAGLIKGLQPSQLLAKAASIVKSVTGVFGNIGKGASGMTAGVVSDITKAMMLTGTSMKYLSGLETIAMKESSGNEKSINLWDSNAKKGTPSKGLFQTIDSTFSRYAMSGHGDIYNGEDNAIAAIRYMIATYGSISNVPGLKSMAAGGAYKGYATGTSYATAGAHWVGEKGPEIVNLKSGDTVTNAKDSANIANSTNGGLTLTITNFYNDGKQSVQELAEEIYQYIKMRNMAIGGSV